MQTAGLLLIAFLSFAQTSSFKWDAPRQCDDCDTWNKPREPFKIHGNTYYVGTDGLSSILITGDAGHILLDGGLEQSAPLIDANIRKLGFKTEDVKLIVNSHAHWDHAAGISALQRRSGARVAASPSGARGLEGGNTVRDDPQAGYPMEATAFPRVQKVKVVRDGEVQRVGNIAVTPVFTPGHTPGATSWTWQSCEGAKCLTMVYADSISAVSAPGYKFTEHPEVIEQLRRSINRMSELPCDIVVSTHPSATGLDAKVAKRAAMTPGAPDPFIDHGCKALATAAMKGLDARLAEEKK